jgi:hypothetical protein
MFDEFLYSLGILNEPQVEESDRCCKEQMQVKNDRLVCRICGAIKSYVANLFDPANPPECTYYMIGNTEYVSHSKRERTATEIIAKHHHETNKELLKNEHSVDNEIVGTTSEYMYTITNGRIKKSKNRKNLRCALLYSSTLEHNKYYTIKDISTLFGMNKHGISEGKKFIIRAIFDGKVDIDLDKPIHHLIIKKYLERIIINGQNLYTPGNAAHCKCIVDCMLEYNIAFNSTLQSKCVGVVYYLVQRLHPKAEIIRKQKNFSREVDISENTYTIVYNALISSDTQAIINEYIGNYLADQKSKKK